MTPTFVGIDVSKNTLDAYRSHDRKSKSLPNTPAGINRLITWLSAGPSPKAIVLEATGGLEVAAANAMFLRGFPVFRANPRAIRDFAKAHQRLAKTDRIDAEVLAKAAEQLDIPPYVPASKDEEQLREVVKRRKDLVDMVVRERHRLGSAIPSGKESLKRHIEWLEKEIKLLDAEINDLMSSETFAERCAILCSAPGVGKLTAATLLAYLSELGTLSSEQLSAMVGLAPFCRDSGKQRGVRQIWGGRAEPRAALYLAAASASRQPGVFANKRKEMLERGKPFKLVIVSLARKLLGILNTMIRRGEHWRSEAVSAPV